MDDKKALNILYQAIEKANESKQFIDSGISLTLDVNAFNFTVRLMDGEQEVMRAHDSKISTCCIEILKWIIIANVPIFKNMFISIDNGEVKVISRD